MKFNIPIILCLWFLFGTASSVAQDSIPILTPESFNDLGYFSLSKDKFWRYKSGNDPAWANPDFKDEEWEKLPTISPGTDLLQGRGKLEGWYRINFKVDPELLETNLHLYIAMSGASRVYLNGQEVLQRGYPNPDKFENSNNSEPSFKLLNFKEENTLAIYYVEQKEFLQKYSYTTLLQGMAVAISTDDFLNFYLDNREGRFFWFSISLGCIIILMLLFVLLFRQNRKDKPIFWMTIFMIFWTGFIFLEMLSFFDWKISSYEVFHLMENSLVLFSIGLFPIIVSKMTKKKTSKWLYKLPFFLWLIYLISWFFSALLSEIYLLSLYIVLFLIIVVISLSIIYKNKGDHPKGFSVIISGIILTVAFSILFFFNPLAGFSGYIAAIPLALVFLTFPVALIIYVAIRFKESLVSLQKNNEEIVLLNDQKIKDEQEKKKILARQNEELELQVAERTQNLTTALDQLKSSQQQLIQQEKLASLGQLTAGIAHEIKNPLNFVNNFSDLSMELIDEVLEEMNGNGSFNKNNVTETLGDVKNNLKKIYQHGTRADSIVKSMLQHSRGGSGRMELTDLNALVGEYVNLSFHGMRAGKNPINVKLIVELDEKMGRVPLIGEDFSRVLLNLCNNAFDAMRDKSLDVDFDKDYKPILTVKTFRRENSFSIEVEDNGPGIPKEMQDKILHPFFTTKKGTEGTGLGLSITHDIIIAHHGTLTVQSQLGVYTRFTIEIPIAEE